MNNIRSNPQAHSFTYQSSTVTYGGSNGAYYTNSMTKRTGSDGVSKNAEVFLIKNKLLLILSLTIIVCYLGFQLRFEEYKEADSVTGQAAHRLSRGIHDKVSGSCFLTLWVVDLWLQCWLRSLCLHFTGITKLFVMVGAYCYKESEIRWSRGYNASVAQHQ